MTKACLPLMAGKYRASKYRSAGREAIARYMFENRQQQFFGLDEICAVADGAARQAGKRSKLFRETFWYAMLLPPGARVFWHKETGTLSVSNPYCSDTQQAIGEVN